MVGKDFNLTSNNPIENSDFRILVSLQVQPSKEQLMTFTWWKKELSMNSSNIFSSEKLSFAIFLGFQKLTSIFSSFSDFVIAS